MGYTEEAVKQINKLIAAQKGTFNGVTNETTDAMAIKIYQGIIAEIEAVIEEAETDEDIADELDEAEKQSRMQSRIGLKPLSSPFKKPQQLTLQNLQNRLPSSAIPRNSFPTSKTGLTASWQTTV